MAFEMQRRVRRITRFRPRRLAGAGSIMEDPTLILNLPDAAAASHSHQISSTPTTSASLP
jgi:hypothetical protein